MADSALKSAALRAAAKLNAKTLSAPTTVRGSDAPAATAEQVAVQMVKGLSFGNSLAVRNIRQDTQAQTHADDEIIESEEPAPQKGKRKSNHLSSDAPAEGLKHVYEASSGSLLLSYQGAAGPARPTDTTDALAAVGLPSSTVSSALSKAVDLSSTGGGGSHAAPSIHAKPRFTRKGQETDAGERWFHLPSQNLTPELKRDLLILRNRSFLDPKRHYKTAREDRSGELPKFFQMGTVVEAPHERKSSTARLTNKERKSSLVAALLADERFDSYAKRTLETVHKRGTQGGVQAYKKRKATEAAGRASLKKHKGPK